VTIDDGDGSAVGVDCVEMKGSIKRVQKDVSIGDEEVGVRPCITHYPTGGSF